MLLIFRNLNFVQVSTVGSNSTAVGSSLGEKHSKYLGFPLVMMQNKTDTFHQLVPEQGFMAKQISLGNKEVLIKVPSQNISCFFICYQPKSLYNEIMPLFFSTCYQPNQTHSLIYVPIFFPSHKLSNLC